VLIFQDGHLGSLLGITATGSIAVFIPIALFCIAFGLSQDYEVFLLSRVKEHYDLTRDNEESIAMGMQLSGRIISALAVLLIVVFAAFALGEVAIVKLFGLGLAIAIVVDAFIIRVTLAPALMRIAGHLNWWAPRPLRRLHLRFGLWESDALDVFDVVDRDTQDAAAGPSENGRTRKPARPKASGGRSAAKPKAKASTGAKASPAKRAKVKPTGTSRRRR
jgi:hypothetical protein